MFSNQPRIPVKQILLVGILPNWLKVLFYRCKGHEIGKNVKIGFGSVICGEKVALGDSAEIGFLSIIRGKHIKIGSHVNIGSLVFIDTPFVEIGDGSRINEQVFVGGLQFPDSSLVLGKNCQIMQMTFINPAKSIRMGDDSGIGGHCLVFGHNSWLSRFEGYPVEFKPIEIGKSVSIAWGAFLLPGSKIGDGAVIGASSVVSREIPPRCLAIGYPARVVQKYPDFPIETSRQDKIDILTNIVDEMIETFKKAGLEVFKNGAVYKVTKPLRRLWKNYKREYTFSVHYEEMNGNNYNEIEKSKNIVLSLWRLPESVRESLKNQGVAWIDIESKEQSDYSDELGDEIILYLKRYGVRLFRVR